MKGKRPAAGDVLDRGGGERRHALCTSVSSCPGSHGAASLRSSAEDRRKGG